MASPKILIQIVTTGTRILGKAFLEAGRQAVKNAKTAPQAAMGGDAAGVGHATSSSLTDRLTRQHRMTLDEAQLILNVKREDTIEAILKNYEHLYKVNEPISAPKIKVLPTKGKNPHVPTNSHYLQSKVVRARQRIEAEVGAQTDVATDSAPTAASAEATPTSNTTPQPNTPLPPSQKPSGSSI